MSLTTLSNIPPEAIWAILGVILIACEFMIPGLVIIFFGFGALVTALATWLFAPSFAVQMVIFAVSSLSSLFILRRFAKNIFMGDQNVSVSSHSGFSVEIGKIVPVVEMIQPGEYGGKVRYQGAPWSAIADLPIAPGDSVKIVGCDNLTLKVEKLDPQNDGNDENDDNGEPDQNDQ